MLLCYCRPMNFWCLAYLCIFQKCCLNTLFTVHNNKDTVFLFGSFQGWVTLITFFKSECKFPWSKIYLYTALHTRLISSTESELTLITNATWITKLFTQWVSTITGLFLPYHYSKHSSPHPPLLCAQEYTGKNLLRGQIELIKTHGWL